MAWHHVIPRHEWVGRFGNLDGFNCVENLVNLTTEQHSDAHKLLFEINGIEYDRVAYLAISGQIGKEEAIRRASVTPEARAKRSAVLMGHKRNVGTKLTPEHRHKMSIGMKGKNTYPRTEEHLAKMSACRLGKKRGAYKKRAQ